jgi:hypothetical protein
MEGGRSLAHQGILFAAFLAVCGLVSTLTGLHLYIELGLASGAAAVLTAALCFGLGMAASPPRWRA